jgi:hypothetical protein
MGEVAQMNFVRLSVIAGLLFASAYCSNPVCAPPATTTYSCEAITAGSNGCVGGPPAGPSAGAPSLDTDKTFPVGCVAQVPYCVPAYPSEVQICTCLDASGSGGTAPGWVCGG